MLQHRLRRGASNPGPWRSQRTTSDFPAEPLVLLVPVVLLLTLIAGVYRSFVPDDLYIYLRFTENLLSGAGPSFNPGHPTYGFTSVLWYGLLSVVGMSGKLLPAARLLSVACALLALPAMHRFAGRLSGSRLVAAAAALLLALDAWFVRWSATGMEASLSVLLLLAGFHRHLREVWRSGTEWSRCRR